MKKPEMVEIHNGKKRLRIMIEGKKSVSGKGILKRLAGQRVDDLKEKYGEDRVKKWKDRPKVEMESKSLTDGMIAGKPKTAMGDKMGGIKEKFNNGVVRKGEGMGIMVYTGAVHNKIAFEVGIRGGSITDLARACKVGVRRLYKWLLKHPGLKQGYDRGVMVASSKVENALYKRALGGERKVIKNRVLQGPEGTTREKVVTKDVMPGDVGAMQFWLRNRSSKRWNKDKGNGSTSIGPNIQIVMDKDDEKI